MAISLDKFTEQFYYLGITERLSIYNNYCVEENSEGQIFDMGDFDIFEDRDALVRAVCYGDVNYTDAYYKIDIYGQMNSITETEALEEIESAIEDFYENEEYWRDYIEPSSVEE